MRLYSWILIPALKKKKNIYLRKINIKQIYKNGIEKSVTGPIKWWSDTKKMVLKRKWRDSPLTNSLTVSTPEDTSPFTDKIETSHAHSSRPLPAPSTYQIQTPVGHLQSPIRLFLSDPIFSHYKTSSPIATPTPWWLSLIGLRDTHSILISSSLPWVLLFFHLSLLPLHFIILPKWNFNNAYASFSEVDSAALWDFGDSLILQ